MRQDSKTGGRNADQPTYSGQRQIAGVGEYRQSMGQAQDERQASNEHPLSNERPPSRTTSSGYKGDPGRKMKRPPKRERNFTSYILRTFLFIVMLVIAVVGISWGFSKLSGKKNESAQTSSPTADSTVEPQTQAEPLTPDTSEESNAAEETSDTAETTVSPLSTPESGEYTYEFTADLSEYEEYMEPADRDAYLTLINVDNPLDSAYVPDDLTDVADTRQDGRSTQQMRLYAEKALEAMLIEARANGFDDVTVTSGYRSYEYQTQLYDARVDQYSYLGDEEAKAMAATIVAIPGTSEHQSGLCADMHNLASADVSFADTDAGKWLAENCFKFGFILRFPEDKTEITGISFEPWHFRYVGRYHASVMHENGLCLEEYCALLEQ